MSNFTSNSLPGKFCHLLVQFLPFLEHYRKKRNISSKTKKKKSEDKNVNKATKKFPTTKKRTSFDQLLDQVYQNNEFLVSV